jgi:MFS family permease
VTAKERMRANSIITFVVSTVAIIAPAIAAQFAKLPDMFGKTGVGGALIYGIYALAVSGTAFIMSTIRLFGGKAKEAKESQAPEAPKPAFTFRGFLKGVASSIVDGVKIILHNRFLTVTTALSLISALFSDPLIFNVLPEFVENVLTANQGLMSLIFNLPVVGWLFKSLVSTPMGYYSMLVVFSSIGSIVATAMAEPLRKLFTRLGFKTEESLTIPFYLLAALEAPLFWLMISTGSPLAILALFGLQTFVTSFAGLISSGLQQKTLGSLNGANINKTLAAQSFLGIVTSIISTCLYGFVLTGIPVATALLIAAVATTIMAIARAAAPWLAFSKEQRQHGSTSETAKP